ncbi:hypothetical protein BV898_20044, partial [Hypsibius exemplaris]
VVLIKAKVALRQRVGDVLRQRALLRRYETSKVLFVCFLWYCLSNFSSSLTQLLYPETFNASPLTQLGLKGLQYVCSALNPAIFTMVSQNYRMGVLQVLGHNLNRQRDPTSLEIETLPKRKMSTMNSAVPIAFRAGEQDISSERP